MRSKDLPKFALATASLRTQVFHSYQLRLLVTVFPRGEIFHKSRQIQHLIIGQPICYNVCLEGLSHWHSTFEGGQCLVDAMLLSQPALRQNATSSL